VAGPPEEATHQSWWFRGRRPWVGGRALEQDVAAPAQPAGEAGQQPPARPDVAHPRGGHLVGLVADENPVERRPVAEQGDRHAAIARHHRRAHVPRPKPLDGGAEQVRVDLDADNLVTAEPVRGERGCVTAADAQVQ